MYAALHIGFLATLYQAIVYSAEIFTCGEITTKASRTDASHRTGRFYTLNDSIAFGIYLCIIYMIFTRLNPLQALKSNKYDANPMLRSSGISISTQFTQVEGRILPTPSVNTSSDKILTPPHHYNLFCIVYTPLLTGSISVVISLQLKSGNGQDLSPRNGRWNFNNKVLCLWFCLFFDLKTSW